MAAFSYLSVLLSIILGLAVQQVLQGYRALLLNRRRIRFDPLPLIWSVLVLVMVAQHWWASFGLATRSEWSFAVFATLLVQTALIYMLAAIVLPDVPPDQTLDLKDHYYREIPAFFGLSLAVIGWSALREFMLEGRLPAMPNGAFHLLYLVMALTALLVRRPWVHRLLAGLMILFFVTYIALLFARLER